MKKSDALTTLMMKLVLSQAIVTVVISVICLVFYDLRVTLSVFFGGLVPTLANLFVLCRLYLNRNKVLSAKTMLDRFYRSESMKMTLTLAMLVLLIAVVKVAVLPFVIAYFVVALLVNWFFLLISG